MEPDVIILPCCQRSSICLNHAKKESKKIFALVVGALIFVGTVGSHPSTFVHEIKVKKGIASCLLHGKLFCILFLYLILVFVISKDSGRWLWWMCCVCFYYCDTKSMVVHVLTLRKELKECIRKIDQLHIPPFIIIYYYFIMNQLWWLYWFKGCTVHKNIIIYSILGQEVNPAKIHSPYIPQFLLCATILHRDKQMMITMVYVWCIIICYGMLSPSMSYYYIITIVFPWLTWCWCWC